MAASMLTSRMASLVISPLKPHNSPVKRATATETRASVSVAPRPSRFSNMNLQIKRVGYSYVNNEPILFSKAPLLLQPVAGRVCPFTGKKSNRANKVSHSKHRTKKLQKVNIQTKRVWWEAGKRMVRLKLSTKALKTVSKKGLDTMAKEAGIDLRKL